jgi:hypothetical protein
MKKILKKSYNKIIIILSLALGIIMSFKGWSDNNNSSQKNKEIIIAAKAFNKADCEKYLDRDLLSKGYQPVQIIIKNTSNKTLIFSPDEISLACADVEQVVQEVHTSTAGRAASYSVAAVFTAGIFAIPAIVDGLKSSNANQALNSDYYKKAAKRQILPPNSKMNSLLFIPSSSYTHSFKLSLKEEGSNKLHKHVVTIG